MNHMARHHEGVTVVLPVPDPEHPAAQLWRNYLQTCRHEWELLTPAMNPLGYGATIREALKTARHPLVLLTDTSYPYSPADLGKLLERIETPGEILDAASDTWQMRIPDLVIGCRTGVPVPQPFRALGAVYRGFCRIVLGMPFQPLPGWYGLREQIRTWWAWVLYGVPVTDPHCGFKLFRRQFLDRFPIQCNGDLVQIELIAKATFLTCLMDEIPLAPRPNPIPYAVWHRADRRVLFRRPKFWKAQETLAIGTNTIESAKGATAG
jgi:hypothetical protein